MKEKENAIINDSSMKLLFIHPNFPNFAHRNEDFILKGKELQKTLFIEITNILNILVLAGFEKLP